MKRLAGIALSLMLMGIAGCLSLFFEKPTFALRTVSISRLSLTDIHLLFGIEVQNPNAFDVKLRALEYTIFLNEKELGKGSVSRETLIAKASSTLVEIPLTASFKNLGQSIEMVLAGQDLRYRIQGAAVFKTILGSTTVPFSQSGEIKIKK